MYLCACAKSLRVSVKQSSIRKLRASNYQGTDQEWETLLRHALLQEHPGPEDASADIINGVEIVATVSDGGKSGQLTLLIRKDISGITQRLGSLALVQDDDQEIELFDWTGIAAQSASNGLGDVVRLQHKLREQQATVARLTAELEELVVAKQEHEDELLGKFTQLLNAKKLKIRNQQRLLSGSRAQRPAAPKEEEEDDDAGVTSKGKGGKGKKASTRAGKRKATEKDDEESDDGFAPAPPVEAMDVDGDEDEDIQIKEEDNDGPVQETPDATDTEAEEDDGDLVALRAPEASSTLRANQPDDDEDVSLPPKRDLPFAKHNLRNKPAPTDNDDDDETEDDEL